jgi:hypothetical protein
VLGAIVFRAIFIAAGTTLLDAFHFLIYGFGLLRLATGVRMWRARRRPNDDHDHPRPHRPRRTDVGGGGADPVLTVSGYIGRRRRTQSDSQRFSRLHQGRWSNHE